MNNTRTDAHRPSAINPADYAYVAESYTGGLAFAYAKKQAEIIAAHMAQTGGTYSTHEHGGNCMVCGSVNAIYTSLFYHVPSNVYVRMGHDCADKVAMGDAFARKAFRKAGDDARQAQAGKAKAQAILADKGLAAAWDIFTQDGGVVGKDQGIIVDMVAKLVKYGSISDKAANFLSLLCKRIEQAPVIAVQRAAEHAVAADVPTGRVTVTGTIVKIETKDTQWGSRTVMTVKSADGWLVWGTVPAAMTQGKGEQVTFVADIERSTTNSKFGFFKRPRLAMAATV